MVSTGYRIGIWSVHSLEKSLLTPADPWLGKGHGVAQTYLIIVGKLLKTALLQVKLSSLIRFTRSWRINLFSVKKSECSIFQGSNCNILRIYMYVSGFQKQQVEILQMPKFSLTIFMRAWSNYLPAFHYKPSVNPTQFKKSKCPKDLG